MLGEHQRDEALIHLRRGLLLERDNRVDEAAAEYRRALAHNPFLAEAHRALGSYYQRRGLLAKAADAYRTVADLVGDPAGYYALGVSLAGIGRHEEAARALRRCLALAPDDPAASAQLARILVQRGAYPEALAHLRRAVAGLPADWELHLLAGTCHLRLGSYPEAEGAFIRAQDLARRPADRARSARLLAAVARFRECPPPHTPKDRIYAEHGAALLGSAGDDGLAVPEAHDYHFTYPDIAATLRRLCALLRGGAWRVDSVLAADLPAQPLAAALADALGLPLRRHGEPAPGERTLAVLAAGRSAELLLALQQRLPHAVSFCLGLAWLRHSDAVPDIVGVIARGACSVPWDAELHRLRAGAAPAAQVAGCLARAQAQVAAALAEAADDPRLDEQLAYYRRRTGLRALGPSQHPPPHEIPDARAQTRNRQHP